MKTKEEILIKYGWTGIIPYEDTITLHSADLLDAMQEYADQFKEKLPIYPVELDSISSSYASEECDKIKDNKYWSHAKYCFRAGFEAAKLYKLAELTKELEVDDLCIECKGQGVKTNDACTYTCEYCNGSGARLNF